MSVCVVFMCLRGSKYSKVISDWLILDVDLYGTILSGGHLRTLLDDVVVLGMYSHCHSVKEKVKMAS